MKNFIVLSTIAILAMSVAASPKPEAEIVPGVYLAEEFSSWGKRDSPIHRSENNVQARATECNWVCQYLPGLPVERCTCTYENGGDPKCCNSDCRSTC